MKNNKIYYLIRTVLLFSYYIFGTIIFNKIFELFGINNSIIPMIVTDIIFFIVIICIYKEKLKINFVSFKNEYSTKKKILIIFKWFFIILIVNMVIGILKKTFSLNIDNVIDENATAVIQLFDISFIYSLFKTLLFAPIAEELLFKESINDVVKNNILFVIISISIYTVMNFMYASSDIVFLDLFNYFIFSVILSIAYIRNNNNIVIVMFIKLFYNIIPTLMLIITMIAGVAA